jgi:DNA-binding beta-propeller fold protein YncE
MKRLVVIGLVALALPAAGAAREAGGTPLALVATLRGNELLVIEPNGGSVHARIPLPRGARDVASSFDAQHVLVASPASNAVTLLDAWSARVLRTFRGIADPADVAVSPDGRRGYVLEKRTGRLIVLDLARRRIASSVAVGARPTALAFSDNLMWIAHESSAAALTVVQVGNPLRPVIQGTVAAGGPVKTIMHVPDSSWLLVTYWNSGVVGKIDAGVPEHIVFRRAVAKRIAALGVDWMTGQIWTGEPDGSIHVLDGQSGRVLRTLRINGQILSIGAYGGFIAVGTPRVIRLFANGKSWGRTPIAAGIAGLDFAVH